jgi:hypothetical protein
MLKHLFFLLFLVLLSALFSLSLALACSRLLFSATSCLQIPGKHLTLFSKQDSLFLWSVILLLQSFALFCLFVCFCLNYWNCFDKPIQSFILEKNGKKSFMLGKKGSSYVFCAFICVYVEKEWWKDRWNVLQ